MLKIKSLIQRPEKGFDPVPSTYAKTYAAAEYKKFGTDLVDRLEENVGQIKNKTLLDLGAGPGQYAIEFAKRGAKVTWHDISQNYLDITKEHAQKEHLDINFSLGYLEEVKGSYDIVFNRICWYYCINDDKFAKLLYQITNKGGYGFIILNNEDFLFQQIKHYSFVKKFLMRSFYFLNEKLNIKMVHVHPSHLKLARIFSRFQFENISIEREGNNTIILYKK